ncbi:aminodeoxychorismate synthase, component I [Halanaeroarchaeum sulfurireducens]|uniref:anthranilate synthase n=1 Tax=Halanaeroarchaeum sulfurireducens TaxID=1604004 RepID=A0A0F7PB11_9EURY|nr:aminodeoxychorismate synthase, component I [Halanaeroarchaeum sulfurireducens]AKH98346.1 para-aminobenzoate synthetase component I [Halanaeroarchaeum sulfurireducens]
MNDVTIATSPEAFRKVATEVPDGTRVPIVGSVTVDPWIAYRRARGTNPSFYFETSGGEPGWGYFGVEPTRFVSVDGTGALDTVETLLDQERLARGECEIPYPGGLFGWLSYDVALELESLPEHTVDDRDLPRLQLGVYETVAAWETPVTDDPQLQIVTSPTIEGDIDTAFDAGVAHIEGLAEAALHGSATVEETPVDIEPVAFESRIDRDRYEERIATVKRYIREGDTFQANISQRLEAPAAIHPVEVFDALRVSNPAPYSGLLEFPGIDLVSASPELLLERTGDQLVTEPIAGTRPRGATESEDEVLADDLSDDEKERAEHAMLVDLERNDLGKVSEYGSVSVDEYRRVDRYSEVMHLVSTVTGTLRPDSTLVDAIRAVFPGGTITGAPKPRTMEIIDQAEETRRGPYTGSMTAFGFDGRATLNIIIRTLVRVEDQYHLRVGGGIVHDSVPDREYEETLDKARALVNAVDAALAEEGNMGVQE